LAYQSEALDSVADLTQSVAGVVEVSDQLAACTTPEPEVLPTTTGSSNLSIQADDGNFHSAIAEPEVDGAEHNACSCATSSVAALRQVLAGPMPCH